MRQKWPYAKMGYMSEHTPQADEKKILDAIGEYYEESVFITDGQGEIIFVNRIGAQRLGADREELLGRNVNDLISEGMYQHSTTLDVIRTGQPIIARINTIGDDHSYSHSVPVKDEEGRVEMVVTNNMSARHAREWESIIENERQKTDRLQRELDYLHLQSQKQKIVAESAVMKNVLVMAKTIAPSDAPVVILGESGTGKDLCARFLHENSPRAENAFIGINCAALPESLMESELFGYEKGSFTGALSKGKIGLFEAAADGTLFLDEIGEMPLSLQSKLLRVLENREIRRVGGVKSIPINVRVICATNTDLQKLVEQKRFREDLYYRLSVFTLRMPPLRERREDIIPIASHLLQQLNEKYGEQKKFSAEAMDTMMRYEWPGNIRELRNVVERIHVISRGEDLVFSPSPLAFLEWQERAKPVLPPRETEPLHQYLDRVAREYIGRVVAENGGSVQEAAKKLGVHRSLLYRKLKTGGEEQA